MDIFNRLANLNLLYVSLNILENELSGLINEYRSHQIIQHDWLPTLPALQQLETKILYDFNTTLHNRKLGINNSQQLLEHDNEDLHFIRLELFPILSIQEIISSFTLTPNPIPQLIDSLRSQSVSTGISENFGKRRLRRMSRKRKSKSRKRKNRSKRGKKKIKKN
jgi:hypothetical protein